MLALLVTLLAAPAPIDWTGWSPAVLTRAATEKKLVLLDVEAVWCHWCHVMDETTYRDRRVAALLGAHFVAVKVDQDSNPALAARYQRYGWPATVVLAADGSEIVRLRGYLEPPRMVQILAAIMRDPSPGPSIEAETKVEPAATALLSIEQRADLQQRHAATFDDKLAGYGHRHKLIWAEALEVDLLSARAGDVAAGTRARRTLDAALALLDPVAGGFYQYSVGDWNSPHYEKIMSVQADAIRSYALSHELFGAPEYLQAAQATARYLIESLSDESGGFHGTQDADVSQRTDGHRYYARDAVGRRALGAPRVDPHLYAREAGLAAEALVALHGAQEDPTMLKRAEAAVRFAVRARSAGDGAFRHGAETDAPLALSDTLAIGRAALALHTATGAPEWLPLAQSAARALQARFCSGAHAGCATAEMERGAAGVFRQPYLSGEENSAVARFANLLFRDTGDEQDRALAERAARYLAAPAVLAWHESQPETLLADAELRREPVHVTIIGFAADPAARALQAAALRYPSAYHRVDVWDGKGPLPLNTKTRYPASERPTAYACGLRSCSAPVTEPKELAAAIDGVLKTELAH